MVAMENATRSSNLMNITLADVAAALVDEEFFKAKVTFFHFINGVHAYINKYKQEGPASATNNNVAYVSCIATAS